MLQDIYGTDMLPYPSVTICPVQLNDRWNLQRALLNEIELFDSEGLLWQGEELGGFDLIFKELLSKNWVHGNALESLESEERSIARRMAAVTMMDDDTGSHVGR